MDRIQRALDMAKLQGQRVAAAAAAAVPVTPPVEDPRAERAALNREFSLGSVESVERLALDWPALKERRVISATDPQPAGHSYRMLRTQVLQRARSNDLGTLGVISA